LEYNGIRWQFRIFFLSLISHVTQCLCYKGCLNTFYILSEIIFSTMNFMFFHFCYSNFWFWKCCTLLIYHVNWTKNDQHVFPLNHHIDKLFVFIHMYLRITFQLFHMLNNALGIKKYATYYTQHEYGPLAQFYSASLLKKAVLLTLMTSNDPKNRSFYR
jgi:hypothetical protein